MNVRDVMTTTVLTTTPETPVRDAALVLASKRISGLPVVDEEGSVVGVFSETDVIAKEGVPPQRVGVLQRLLDPEDTWSERRLNATLVSEAMSAPVVTISPDRPLSEAATLMLGKGVNRLPVVDDGTLVGIVTRADLVRAFVRTDEAIRAEIVDAVVRRALWLDPSEVGIEVDHGHVRLTGQVSTDIDAELLTTFTRRVAGVVDVVSEVDSRDTGQRPAT